MTKEMELLGKLELSEENRAKLLALLEEGKKSGKVSSKKLVETLDAVDATEEQTEQFYDVLEAAHVEIDVSDVLDLIGTAELDNPTLGEMEAIEAEALEVSDKQLEEEYENAKLDDPVRMYLKEIGKIPLLTPEEDAVFKRGRNAAVHGIPKNATTAQYHQATALECLLGWLYLRGDTKRVNQLFTVMMEEDQPCR